MATDELCGAFAAPPLHEATDCGNGGGEQPYNSSTLLIGSVLSHVLIPLDVAHFTIKATGPS